MFKKNIVLIGMMAAGKTTIGFKLAKKLKMQVNTHHETNSQKNIAVFVTKEPHCLNTILKSRSKKEIKGNISVIVGTEKTLSSVAKKAKIPFVLINERNQDKAETKILQVCKKYDVLTFIVAHPTKMYKGQDGKMEEPTMYNIKGGGEWYDASYHGLLVHRDYEAKNTKVKVLKVKFQNLGENGAESFFTWEPKSGCYIPEVIEEQQKEDLPWEA